MREQWTSGVVPVEMTVSRFQRFPRDKLVQVWGWVGDYEVSVWLPSDDPRLAAILPSPRPAQPRKGRS